MRHSLAVLLALAACGCREAAPPSPNAAPPASADAVQVAREFLQHLAEDPDYQLGVPGALTRRMTAERVPATTLARGLVGLLKEGTADEKCQSARTLGRLGDPAAIPPLVAALQDADEHLRAEACYALGGFRAPGESAPAALVSVRRSDPSVDVRVAAALALGRPEDPDAVAAFDLGARTTQSGPVREACEDALQGLRRLQLPLPDGVYEEVSVARYEEIKKDRWYAIEREVKAGDRVYFETVEHPPHARAIRSWYRTRPEPAGAAEERRAAGQAVEDKALRLRHGGSVRCMAVSPDEKLLASGGDDGRVKLWEVGTGKALRALPLEGGVIRRLAFSPDGTRLAAGCVAGRLIVWDVTTGQARFSLDASAAGGADDLAFSPDGGKLVFTVGGGERVQVCDAATGKELGQTALPGAFGTDATAVAFSRDATRVAAAGGDSVRVWDAQTGQSIWAGRAGTTAVHFLAFSPDARHLACGGMMVAAVDARTGASAALLQGQATSFSGAGSGVFSLGFSRTGDRLASIDGEGVFAAWDVQTGGRLLHFRVPGGQVTNLVLLSDGKRVVTCNWDRSDGTVTVWDIGSLQRLQATGAQ